jgi:tripartite-type tricarboxylate transporter receptor subunit TctC
MKAVLCLLAGAALAQSAAPAGAVYPEKSIMYYQAFPAGGESDISARHQQLVLRKRYNQDMVVQYKPGAGGGVAWAQLNSLPGDGYTIMGINLPHIVLQPLEGLVQYKTEDITPVYFYHYTPDALVVANDSPYKSFQDFIKAAKAKPGVLTLGGSGTNSANHLAHEKLDLLAGIKTTYVPFKGTGDLTPAVIGQHVSGAMSYSAFAMAQRGKVRMLAVAMDKRHPQFPEVPTFKELGFDWVDGAYRGVGVPKSTPPEMRKQISDLFDALNNDPEMKKLAAVAGFELININLEKMQAFFASRQKEYIEIARRMGLAK